jgi:TrwC relaxase
VEYPLDDDVRAQIRTTLARQRFADQYGRQPADDRELSGFIARNTRARTTAVAGYDVTFSQVKSVSALWAVAPLEVTREHREDKNPTTMETGVVVSASAATDTSVARCARP